MYTGDREHYAEEILEKKTDCEECGKKIRYDFDANLCADCGLILCEECSICGFGATYLCGMCEKDYHDETE
jgi:ribosomal protein L37E